MVRPLKERFWEKVKKSKGCWVWTGAKFKKGYGSIWQYETRRYRRAHCISWELANGAIPFGMEVLHKCDNRACVRPDHLFLGSQKDNMQDMFLKRRDNHAKGERVNTARLTEDQVREIKQKYTYRKCSYKKLAEEYGVGKSTIQYIVTGRSWGYLNTPEQPDLQFGEQ